MVPACRVVNDYLLNQLIPSVTLLLTFLSNSIDENADFSETPFHAYVDPFFTHFLKMVRGRNVKVGASKL